MSRLLVCPPDHYQIAYEINPWMDVKRGADPTVARVQWNALVAALEKNCGATLERIEPVAGLPDMVFTANAGIVAGRTVVLSQFRYPERRPEETPFERWFQENGYEVKRMPPGLYFEGAGDMLGTRDMWFGGYLQRTDIRAYRYVGEFLGREILPLELVDPRFYHLDTCQETRWSGFRARSTAMGKRRSWNASLQRRGSRFPKRRRCASPAMRFVSGSTSSSRRAVLERWRGWRNSGMRRTRWGCPNSSSPEGRRSA
jgi:hypothetical protein